MGLRVGHRRRGPDRRRGGRDRDRRARPAARLQQRQRGGVRSARRDSRDSLGCGRAAARSGHGLGVAVIPGLTRDP